MDFLHALTVVLVAGTVYSVVDLLIRNLDGYVYIRSIMILIWLLAASLDYFMEWSGLTRLVFESYITGLAVMFFLPVYIGVKLLFYAIDSRG